MDMSSRGQIRTMDYRQRDEYGDPRAALDFSVKKIKKDHAKENGPTSTDAPIDLSKKPSSPPDVIMLSDSDDDSSVKINGFANGDLDESKLIRKLQEDLRNEEAKLVLFKKMRQSQRNHQLQETNDNVANKAHQGRSTVPPPPLMRNAHSNIINNKQQIRSTSNGQPVVRSSPQQGPPPLMSSARERMTSHMGQVRASQQQQQSAQSLLAGYRIPTQQSNSHSSQNNQVQSAVDNQTPGQRQAAAKLALRKQLEKTLLQIPPPKPPPPEMNFIPSLASNEFIMLVGLEEVVKTITDLDSSMKGLRSSEVKYVFNPFTCVQCSSDFTPVWKRDKPGSKNVICEDCVTNNQKKALKQEHTNRLKSAFVKALQQEQEIEQRLQAQPQSTSVSSPSPVSNQAVNIPGSYKLTHQNLMQAHQAQLQNAQQHLASLPAAAFANSRLPFPFPYGAKPSDIQRQYLLDMIPSGRPLHPSISQLQWKS